MLTQRDQHRGRIKRRLQAVPHDQCGSRNAMPNRVVIPIPDLAGRYSRRLKPMAMYPKPKNPLRRFKRAVLIGIFLLMGILLVSYSQNNSGARRVLAPTQRTGGSSPKPPPLNSPKPDRKKQKPPPPNSPKPDRKKQKPPPPSYPTVEERVRRKKVRKKAPFPPHVKSKFTRMLQDRLDVYKETKTDYSLPDIMEKFESWKEGSHLDRFKSWKKVKHLGNGSYGKVYEFIYSTKSHGGAPGKNYAVKFIDKKYPMWGAEKTAALLQKELTYELFNKNGVNATTLKELKRNRHFIGGVVKTYDEPDYFIVVMELGDAKDLLEHIMEKDGPVQSILNRQRTFDGDDDDIKFYAACLVRAVELMHRKNIVHRDLKPENILVDPETGYLKVADFGLATKFTDKKMGLNCGTPGYNDPQMLLDLPYGKEVDWFSFSVVLYILVTGGIPPFRNDTRKGYKSANSWLKECGCSSLAKDLVGKLLRCYPGDRWNLQKDPAKRGNTMNRVRDHPWFKGFNWKLLDSGKYPAPWVPAAAA